MTAIADQLDNADFNTIAKSSLLELMYIINQQKNTAPNGHHGCNIITFFIKN